MKVYIGIYQVRRRRSGGNIKQKKKSSNKKLWDQLLGDQTDQLFTQGFKSSRWRAQLPQCRQFFWQNSNTVIYSVVPTSIVVLTNIRLHQRPEHETQLAEAVEIFPLHDPCFLLLRIWLHFSSKVVRKFSIVVILMYWYFF